MCYMQNFTANGFILTNPLLNAPIGQKIGYPPLFHFLFAVLGKILNIDYMLLARIIQPILAFSVVLSVTYVAKRFYGNIAGICAGFLMISSTIIYRIMLPVPENLALIFLPIAVYLYYNSIKEKKIKYAFISGILMVLIAATHQAAFLCLIIIITTFTIVELLIYRDKDVLKNYGLFLLSLSVMVFIVLIVILILKPILIQNIINQGITATLGFETSLKYNQTLSFVKYIRNFGLLLTIFSVIGTIFAIKTKQKKDIYIFTWIIILLLLSRAYWIGINVISARVLIYIVIPLSILGGFGVSQIYYRFKDFNNFSSRFCSSFLICIFFLSTFLGVLNVSDPHMGSYYAQTIFGKVQIAPPSSSETDLFKLV